MEGGLAAERGGEAEYTARLLIACPDRPGIVAAVSGFLFEREANIVSSHQYSSDPTGGRFFMRTEFFLPPGEDPALLSAAFADQVAGRFGMQWTLRRWGERQRTAILVSRQDHCLLDLIWRRRRGELETEIVRGHLQPPGPRAGGCRCGHPVPPRAGRPTAPRRTPRRRCWRCWPVAPSCSCSRATCRSSAASFLARVGMPAINIHHSFLPAFAGADPYRRAHERGVKLIGATAHYVTEELDDGPIIDQDVLRVDHRSSAGELARMGRDVERMVLARAVARHLEDRVLVDGRRTVVF